MNFPSFSNNVSDIKTTFGKAIHYFSISPVNIDPKTVDAFGDEWLKFNSFSTEEINSIAEKHYFDIVDKSAIRGKSVLDMGCGTGRWSKYISAYAATVDAVDPSEAVIAAAKLLADCPNVRISNASVANLPFADNTFDFVFSLGVLHHIPDTALAMQQCVNKLKKDGFFLVYLYYSFDNRGFLYKSLFKLSGLFRKIISILPHNLKNFVCDVIAITVYLPLIFLSSFVAKVFSKEFAKHFPLSFYIGKSFHVIRNDARDRFGTPLEQRFSKEEITSMMESCGLKDIVFSDQDPYWHAIGRKA